MKIRTFIITLLSLCALHSGAQTLTATYVELADSADRYIRQERWADAERVIVKALRHEPPPPPCCQTAHAHIWQKEIKKRL